MPKLGKVVRLVVDKDAVEITRELLRMAEAGEVSGIAFVLRTTHREYHVMFTGVFEDDPIVAEGASSLIRVLAEKRAAGLVPRA